MPVAAVPLILATIATAGTASSMESSRRSASQQKDSTQMQMNAQKAADAEMRRQRVREERVKRAQIVQFAEGTGTTQSSGVEGATSSLETQVGSSFAFQTGQATAAQDIGAKQQDAADSLFQGQIEGSIGNLATQGFTNTKTYKSLFSA